MPSAGWLGSAQEARLTFELSDCHKRYVQQPQSEEEESFPKLLNAYLINGAEQECRGGVTLLPQIVLQPLNWQGLRPPILGRLQQL